MQNQVLRGLTLTKNTIMIQKIRKKETEKETLTAIRTKKTYYNLLTEYRNSNGKLIAYNNTMLNQLRFGSKVATFKGVEYKLKWLQSETK